MNRFLQLHLLTSYPPSNLNRDDLGRPKTAMIGGATRLRVSSQSLKRAWRTSDFFGASLGGHMGTRTKEKGVHIYQQLLAGGIAEKKAAEWAKSIAAVFGKLKTLTKEDEKKLKDESIPAAEREALALKVFEIEQLAHFSPEEISEIEKLIAACISRKSEPTEVELKLLRENESAVDIALFGRMLAASPKFSVEAAAQVAHAITVHKVAVENDFFTAVDDLNKEDSGAAHMGETEFGTGLFYLYLCVDRELLLENLRGDKALMKKAIASLVESAAKIAPTGKQNSFASRARASYILCETGNQQPRSLSVAFLEPVGGTTLLGDSIARLKETRHKMDKVYSACADRVEEMNAHSGEGSLETIIACAVE